VEVDKIIVRTEYLEGGDKSLIDYDITGSVKVVRTEVVEPMFKVKAKAFITTKEPLLPKEVIQVGNLNILYRVISLVKKTTSGGNMHRVKRVDGYNITQTDIDAINVKDVVRIKSRKTYNQLMRQ
jgi:hypothetical protein